VLKRDTIKGYGFIQPQGSGKDVFVHISAVECADLSNLNEGVEYEEVSNRGKFSADFYFALSNRSPQLRSVGQPCCFATCRCGIGTKRGTYVPSILE
jgi:cold shock protein